MTTELITIFSSNSPMDCHILKGRLESDGITCFIFDENMVWVHPFRAVAIGGVKLKIPVDQALTARKIMEAVRHEKLYDNDGEYDIHPVFEKVFERQNEILTLKSRIRKDISLIDRPSEIKTPGLDQDELNELVNYEKEFHRLSGKRFIFDWNQFWYECLDFDRSVFNYFRVKPVEYYIEKETVDYYLCSPEDIGKIKCPRCHSDNLSYGYAIDYKWDVLYLILSAIIFIPLYLIRNKYHCFNCGLDFHQPRSVKSRRV